MPQTVLLRSELSPAFESQSALAGGIREADLGGTACA
jgi:hypothetical protein